jgi:hypothetical protein
MMKVENVSEIFKDPVVKRASYWVLSMLVLLSRHSHEHSWARSISSCFEGYCVLQHLTSYAGHLKWPWRRIHRGI